MTTISEPMNMTQRLGKDLMYYYWQDEGRKAQPHRLPHKARRQRARQEARREVRQGAADREVDTP